MKIGLSGRAWGARQDDARARVVADDCWSAKVRRPSKRPLLFPLKYFSATVLRFAFRFRKFYPRDDRAWRSHVGWPRCRDVFGEKVDPIHSEKIKYCVGRGSPSPAFVFFLEDGRVVNVSRFPGSTSVTRRRHSAKTTTKLEKRIHFRKVGMFLKRSPSLIFQ